MYIVQCTVLIVQCAVGFVQCTLYNGNDTWPKCEQCSAAAPRTGDISQILTEQSAVNTERCVVKSVHYTVYSVQRTLNTVL